MKRSTFLGSILGVIFGAPTPAKLALVSPPLGKLNPLDFYAGKVFICARRPNVYYKSPYYGPMVSIGA